MILNNSNLKMIINLDFKLQKIYFNKTNKKVIKITKTIIKTIIIIIIIMIIKEEIIKIKINKTIVTIIINLKIKMIMVVEWTMLLKIYIKLFLKKI
jgi:hypothetical protein